MFREENQVHVVHGDDGWEESEESWELGEDEMMIVRAVQREEDCSWQDACKSWMVQDEETAAGVYQVEACQEAIKQLSVGQCKEVGFIEADEKASEPDDLLLEGEEQEYFFELLMRKASPERPKAGQLAKNRGNSKDKAASTKGKEKKRNKKEEKKVPGKSKAEKEAGGQRKEKGTTGPDQRAGEADSSRPSQ